jgi:hypothetical protein
MKINVYKKTNDDWYPNFKIENGDDLVRVSFTQTGPDPNLGYGDWRVCVWGNDDCGMERDFILEGEALNIFYQVIGWDSVDMDKLEKLGFVSA